MNLEGPGAASRRGRAWAVGPRLNRRGVASRLEGEGGVERGAGGTVGAPA